MVVVDMAVVAVEDVGVVDGAAEVSQIEVSRTNFEGGVFLLELTLFLGIPPVCDACAFAHFGNCRVCGGCGGQHYSDQCRAICSNCSRRGHIESRCPRAVSGVNAPQTARRSRSPERGNERPNNRRRSPPAPTARDTGHAGDAAAPVVHTPAPVTLPPGNAGGPAVAPAVAAPVLPAAPQKQPDAPGNLEPILTRSQKLRLKKKRRMQRRADEATANASIGEGAGVDAGTAEDVVGVPTTHGEEPDGTDAGTGDPAAEVESTVESTEVAHEDALEIDMDVTPDTPDTPDTQTDIEGVRVPGSGNGA